MLRGFGANNGMIHHRASGLESLGCGLGSPRSGAWMQTAADPIDAIRRCQQREVRLTDLPDGVLLLLIGLLFPGQCLHSLSTHPVRLVTRDGLGTDRMAPVALR